MAMSWEQHYRAEEEAELGRYRAELEAALKERSEGRNQGCWPVCSFGGKDADLDPEGCTGIREIVGLNEDGVTVKVGGHKSVSPPERESEAEQEALRDQAQELVSDCGWNGEWTGDDWTVHFTADLVIPLPWDDAKTAAENVAAQADLVVAKAREACKPFETAATELHKAVNALDEAEAGGETDEFPPLV